MATSSIPAAVDYLVAQTRALPECAAPVTVHDGYPVGAGQTGVAIGVIPNEDGDTPNEVVHGQLGAQMEREYYDIPCEIAAWVGGGEEATKAARDAAFVILDALITRIRQDRTLGGALHSGWAMLTGIRMEQTADPEEAGEGRTCSIKFAIHCENKF